MDQYGLIGYPLTHSFSKKYFTDKFAWENIQAKYELYSLTSIKELSTVLESNPALRGLNVTIPYKKQVIEYLYDSTEAVKEMQACNCIKIIEGRLFGHNTDVTGFENSLEEYLKPHHTKALVLGTGGAAAAVEYVLRKRGIQYLLVSRNKDSKTNTITYDELNEDIMNMYTVIINTTPLGMYPKVDESPAINYHSLTSRHYLFDLVYNPAKTVFLKKGEEQGAVIKNGEEMLIIQAEESWKIWRAPL